MGTPTSGRAAMWDTLSKKTSPLAETCLVFPRAWVIGSTKNKHKDQTGRVPYASQQRPKQLPHLFSWPDTPEDHRSQPEASENLPIQRTCSQSSDLRQSALLKSSYWCPQMFSPGISTVQPPLCLTQVCKWQTCQRTDCLPGGEGLQ